MTENVTKDDGYNHFNASRDGVLDLWNSKYYKEMRKAMLDGERLDKCHKCWFAEDNNLQSLRRPKNFEYYKSVTNEDGEVDTLPKEMELHFGNVCNLSCKMCSTQFSHLIGKELLKIGHQDPDFLTWVRKESGLVNNWTSELDVVYDWYKNTKIKNEIFEMVSTHVQSITVIGGEPTIIPEFWELLQYCSDRKTLKDKHMVITTNLTNTNPKLIDWLPQLQSFMIHASVDGIGERNHYIRYPSNWKSIEKSLDFYGSIIRKGANGVLSFNPAIQTLNIDHLIDMVEYFETYDDVANYSWLSHVKGPVICDYDHAPQNYKNRTAEHLINNLHRIKNWKNKEEIKGHATRLQQDFTDANTPNIHKAFIRYNDTQDKFRNTKTWRKILPDLEKALTEVQL